MFRIETAHTNKHDVEVTRTVEGLTTAWVDGRMVGQFTHEHDIGWVANVTTDEAVLLRGKGETAWHAAVYLIHIYADHDGEPNPMNTPLPIPAPEYDDNDCQGHDGGPLTEDVYCDGSCRTVRSRSLMRTAKIEAVAELVRLLADGTAQIEEGSEAQADHMRDWLTTALKALPPARN